MRMTLYSAFFTMEMDSPAEMSSRVAPSFWACFTEEFMNTVQREPRSTGCFASRPRRANSSTGRPPAAWAKVCMKEPQPEEQASFRKMSSMASSFILKHLMSWPPMSMMKSTPGCSFRAAIRWAMVSTTPQSSRKAVLTSASP